MQAPERALDLPEWAAALLLAAAVGLTYGHYADSPTFFDDVYFFIDPQKYLSGLNWASVFDRRWVATASLALTYKVSGTAPFAYRAFSLAVHAAVAFSLFLLLRDMVGRRGPNDAFWPALCCALLFALHPVAAFAVGYIIERSMLLAALFSLWMWIAVHRGISRNSRAWLMASALFYWLAMFSKEHAVTALPVAVLVAWNAGDGDWRRATRMLAWPLVIWGAAAAFVVLSAKGLLGAAYEPIVGEMLQGLPADQGTFYLRSAVNQGWLFFRYWLLWLLPVETWMSIDMRVPFPSAWYSWPWIAGALAFCAWPVAVAAAAARAWLPRPAVVGLLAPWFLYLTMFSVIEYQESFVLYRSYLWALPAFLLPCLALTRLPRRGQIAAMLSLGLFLFTLTWGRLQVFSHPMLVWDEAVERLAGDDSLPGAYRDYQNRGLEYFRLGNIQRALDDFEHVIALNPGYMFVYNDRGAAYLKLGQLDKALADFDRTIAAKPEYPKPYLGRGMTLLRMGRRDDGLASLARACQLGSGCAVYRKAVASQE